MANAFFQQPLKPRPFRAGWSTRSRLGSFLTLDQKLRDLAQRPGTIAELFQRGVSLGDKFVGLLGRGFNAEQRRICRLVMRGVFACGLAQLLRSLGDVE